MYRIKKIYIARCYRIVQDRWSGPECSPFRQGSFIPVAFYFSRAVRSYPLSRSSDNGVSVPVRTVRWFDSNIPKICEAEFSVERKRGPVASVLVVTTPSSGVRRKVPSYFSVFTKIIVQCWLLCQRNGNGVLSGMERRHNEGELSSSVHSGRLAIFIASLFA